LEIFNFNLFKLNSKARQPGPERSDLIAPIPFVTGPIGTGSEQINSKKREKKLQKAFSHRVNMGQKKERNS
jgi:hypothetical protein